MIKEKFHFYKETRRSVFGVLFSLVVIIFAVPFWVGALIEQPSYIDLFAADTDEGFYVNQEIKFKIEGGDKQDNRIDALLDYGDGDSYDFKLYRGTSYTKRHVYERAGNYEVKLTLEDSTNKEKSFKLSLEIKDEWQPEIKHFSFNEESSNNLGGWVYLDYEISCPQVRSDYKAKIDWGDENQEIIQLYFGPAIISHYYEDEGDYDIKLSLEDLEEDEIIDEKELRVLIEEEKIERHDPKARFFLRTAWPVANEPIIFVDACNDPDGKEDLDKWLWDFGDKNKTYDRNPTHTFDKADSYKVSLTVWDKSGRKDTYYQWIEVFEEFDYDLVRISGKKEVYQIIEGRYHWIPTPAIFRDYGFNEDDVTVINQADFNRYQRAKVVRVNGGSDIYYLTEKWMKRRVPNMKVFYSYGNELSDIISISRKEFNWYEENNLIKYDDDWKIYYLESGQKHWIKSPAVFNKHGFDWGKVAPVNWQELNAWPTGAAVD